MKRLDIISTFAIFATGFIHTGGTLWFFAFLVEPGTVGVDREVVLWWVSGAMAFWFATGFNLLRIYQREAAPAAVPLLGIACLPTRSTCTSTLCSSPRI